MTNKPNWQDEYDNIFGIKHYQVCVGKKCSCHKEVKDFIRTHFIAKNELVELIEDMDYKESRDPNGKWTTWISKSDLLAKLKEME